MHPRDKLTALLWGGVPRHPGARQPAAGAAHPPPGPWFERRRSSFRRGRASASMRGGWTWTPSDWNGRCAPTATMASSQSSGSTGGTCSRAWSWTSPPSRSGSSRERERLPRAGAGGPRPASRPPAHGRVSRGWGLDMPVAGLAHRPPLPSSPDSCDAALRRTRSGAATALRHYRECLAVLQRELEAEPEAETRQLYQEILRDRLAQPSRVGVGQTTADAPAACLAPIWLHQPSGSRRFRSWVGWPSSSGSARRSTRPGAGTRSCSSSGVRQGSGRAGSSPSWPGTQSDGEAAPSSASATRATRRCRSDPGSTSCGPRWPRSARSWGPGYTWRVELMRLLPELGDAATSLPEGPMHHRRLFEAVAAFVYNLADTRPVLLVLEDLHWADEPSLRLLASLSRRLADAPVLVVASVRDEDLADVPERARLLHVVTESAATVTLGPLSRPDTATLVAALGRRGADAAAVCRLHEPCVGGQRGPPTDDRRGLARVRERAGRRGAPAVAP